MIDGDLLILQIPAKSQLNGNLSHHLAQSRKPGRACRLGGARDMILCQTENISSSGMLIKTDKRYEVGAEIEFEFTLPNDERPISGRAAIVRHTQIGRDQVGGVGLRFLSFSGDSQRRFQWFLYKL